MNDYLQANQRRWDHLTTEHENSLFYDLAGFKTGKDRLPSMQQQPGDDGDLARQGHYQAEVCAAQQWVDGMCPSVIITHVILVTSEHWLE